MAAKRLDSSHHHQHQHLISKGQVIKNYALGILRFVLVLCIT